MIRYQFIQNKVLNIYRTLSTIEFPVKVYDILKTIPNCKIMSYQALANITHNSLGDVITLCESKSGCTHYDILQDRYLILFNNSTEQNNNRGRQLWTCCHEIGHIVCDHMAYSTYAKISENGFFNITNKEYESEADFFAATILAPFPLFSILDIHSPSDVQDTFGLSNEAASYRYNEYLKWKNSHVKTAWENDMRKVFKQNYAS